MESEVRGRGSDPKEKGDDAQSAGKSAAAPLHVIHSLQRGGKEDRKRQRGNQRDEKVRRRRQSGEIKRREVPRPIQGHGSARARRRHHLLQDHINQTARRMDQKSARTCCNTTVTMTKQTKPSRHAEMRVLTHTHTPKCRAAH